MDYQTTTLPCGLRVIVLPSASRVAYCGIAVHAGTRHEEPGEEGLAHFCEHLAFKGTHRRTAVQLINAIEGVGGELNAFTTKEDTVFYSIVTRQHLGRAIDVLCDIVFQSSHPEAEVEKEREVVCDEIESYEDSPAELIFDDFENILFQGHPLGHNILGSSSQVRAYGRADAQRFTGRYYHPANSVLFVLGQTELRAVEKMVERAARGAGFPIETSLSSSPGGSSLSGETSFSGQLGQTVVRQRGTHQAHVMVGTRTFGADDSRRWALFLLNNILGGPGLNSRLNLSLRERRALVYTVESQMVTYSDTGLWSVYFGCDAADVKRCLRLVRKELDRLMLRPLSDSQLKKARQQLHGQLAIGAENREQFALDMAKLFLHEQREHSLDALLQRVDAVTAADLLAVARELFAAERITTLIYE